MRCRGLFTFMHFSYSISSQPQFGFRSRAVLEIGKCSKLKMSPCMRRSLAVATEIFARSRWFIPCSSFYRPSLHYMAIQRGGATVSTVGSIITSCSVDRSTVICVEAQFESYIVLRKPKSLGASSIREGSSSGACKRQGLLDQTSTPSRVSPW